MYALYKTRGILITQFYSITYIESLMCTTSLYIYMICLYMGNYLQNILYSIRDLDLVTSIFILNLVKHIQMLCLAKKSILNNYDI